MCGIAGYFSLSRSQEVKRGAVDKMCSAMIYRGPDDMGIASFDEVCLGMRRLAIFDPAHGHQPMTADDGRYTLVFNGAIYNFKELRGELEGLGRRFLTDCDTEVLLQAYAQWGQQCLGRLRGMFAFAVWDASAQTLFAARDPFGIKPLYYRAEPDGSVLFASEIKALVASEAFSPTLDPKGVTDYLGWLSVPAPRTIYAGVRSLRPGEKMTVTRTGITIAQHWIFPPSSPAPQSSGSRNDFVAELRARLEDSVRAHAVADVPVGAFLSGGLDSAVIVALMGKLSGTRIKTFSIVFGEESFSEGNEASETARHLGTDHAAKVLTGGQVLSDLDQLLGSFDQPTGDGINTFYASRAARNGGVTVALSGLGGDEVFGGYPSFNDVPSLASWVRVSSRLPLAARSALAASLQIAGTRGRKLADFILSSSSLGEVNSLQRRVFDSRSTRRLLMPGHAPFEVRHPELATLVAELDGAGTFETISAWELRTYMADVLLRDSDVMSMSQSLELRVPFVDRPLIEWLWRQPTAFKEGQPHPKAILAEATKDLLPPGLLTRRKRGFTLPFPLWMRGPLRPFLEETFSQESISYTGLFSTPEVQRFWRGFLNGSDSREWSRVWSLAMLIAFCKNRKLRP